MKNHTLASLIVMYASGLVFALGLIISGMINPAKIINFLDIYGSWDATLAFVFLGALLITVPAYRLLDELPHPLFENEYHLPINNTVDLRLIGGSALFGVGWGIGGLCPGPSLTALATGQWQIFLFVASMLTGAYIAKNYLNAN